MGDVLNMLIIATQTGHIDCEYADIDFDFDIDIDKTGCRVQVEGRHCLHSRVRTDFALFHGASILF